MPALADELRANAAAILDTLMRRAPEPFYTTRREGSGTGLGLSQIYGFAQQVGGGLQIDSAEGRGTSVHLFFPRAEALGVRSATSA